MISRNIGRNERILRFAVAVLLLLWALAGDSFGIPQGFATVVAMALLWNSIFARCYLWKWLGISSCDPISEDCSPGGGAGPSRA